MVLYILFLSCRINIKVAILLILGSVPYSSCGCCPVVAPITSRDVLVPASPAVLGTPARGPRHLVR